MSTSCYAVVALLSVAGVTVVIGLTEVERADIIIARELALLVLDLELVPLELLQPECQLSLRVAEA